MFDRSRTKPLSSNADERTKASAAELPRVAGFGVAAPNPAASGGFGRRKTPIPETTDGAAPSSVANDTVAVPGVAAPGVEAPSVAAPNSVEPSIAVPPSTGEHPFFNAPRADDDPLHGPMHGYDGPLSVSDEMPGRLVNWLSNELRTGRAVSYDAVLCALGALAGYSAQQAIREAVVKSGRLTLDQAFVVIETRSGEAFFFGDLLNAIIGANDSSRNSSQFTIWKIVSDAGYEAGALNLPDVTDIVKHCAATVGGPDFGLPRLPDAYMPSILPRDAVNRFWPAAHRRLAGSGPMSWPLQFAMAAHKLIVEMKDTIRPDIAVRIVMEAVVPMSKIDPLTVPKE